MLENYLKLYFSDILNVFSDGIYISDHTGKTLKVNSMYEKLTGLKMEELEGRLVTDLKAEGKFDVILNPDIVRTGEPKTSIQITKVGRKVILFGFPIFDKCNKVVLVVTFVRDITLLSQLKDQIAAQQELIEKYQREVRQLTKKSTSLIFRSAEMARIMQLAENVAKTDATILILGETGVGKDVLARKIHEISNRANEIYIKVDCTTIPPNLIESELFGYEPGAFSGAHAKGKAGFFEVADKGTLFLDEIGELPPPMQSKLLRVLQDQEIMRVGSTRVKKVDVRFIAATNKNLEEGVSEGTFRSDLYYRLKVAVLHLLPLRDRKDDILPLANYFLEKYNTKYKKRAAFSSEAEKVLENYKWPGNIREMENLTQSLIVTREKDAIEVTDLPVYMIDNIKKDAKLLLPDTCNFTNQSLNELMGNIEKDLLARALMTDSSISGLANMFKVDRSTIFRKLKKYSLI